LALKKSTPLQQSPQAAQRFVKSLIPLDPKKVTARRNECYDGLLFPPEQIHM
jgi:hypothetical protein